jgi:flagellin-like hook-associated protein FlgL
VDISKAVTVGDVVRQIEAHPPAGRSVSASVTGQGITLQLDSAGGGNLTVQEVGSGTVAGELGILNPTGVLTAPLVGTDLDPVVTKTTRLDDLLGAKATTRLVSAGNDNNLLIQAAVNGSQYNGATVQIVDDEKLRATPGVGPGGEYAQYDASARAAYTSLAFTGAANDLKITATSAGTAFNNVSVSVVGGGPPGDATANYDPVTKRLTIAVDSTGASTVDSVVNAVNGTGLFTATHDDSAEGAVPLNGSALISTADINNVSGDTSNSGGAANTLYVFVAAGRSTANQVAAAINAQGTFKAQLDTLDTTNSTLAGTGLVSLTATATSSGGSGTKLDQTSGIQIVNGGSTHTISFAGATTVEDLLNKLNGSDANVLAEINADGTGINIHSRLSGSDFQIGENGGQTATQLGIRSFTGETRLDDLNYGIGVPTKRDGLQSPPAVVNDFTIVANDGTGPVNIDIDASSASTVQDVLDLINNNPANNTGGVSVVARLATSGNGIELVDQNGRPLTINSAEGSQAAQYLGLVPSGSTTATSAGGTITGTDKNYLESSSVFTTLVRLKTALDNNDVNGMQRAIQGIDTDIDRVTSARSDVGAREQALDITTQNMQDEDVQLRSALSNDTDVDLVQAISELTARQVSLEASLKTTASILQLSLLNFL